MKYKLSGFANPAKSGDGYMTMMVNEYDTLINILNTFSGVTNTPLRKHNSVHIWIGPRMAKIVKNIDDISNLGVFSVLCEIKKNGSGQINITTVGLPDIDHDIDYKA